MTISILNKQGNFGVKILWRYTDMAIFVLRCFILTHPVYVPEEMDFSLLSFKLKLGQTEGKLSAPDLPLIGLD